MAHFKLAKLIQLDYNSKGQYLHISKNSNLHKLLFTKDFGDGRKIVFVFNELSQSPQGLPTVSRMATHMSALPYPPDPYTIPKPESLDKPTGSMGG